MIPLTVLTLHSLLNLSSSKPPCSQQTVLSSFRQQWLGAAEPQKSYMHISSLKGQPANIYRRRSVASITLQTHWWRNYFHWITQSDPETATVIQCRGSSLVQQIITQRGSYHSSRCGKLLITRPRCSVWRNCWYNAQIKSPPARHCWCGCPTANQSTDWSLPLPGFWHRSDVQLITRSTCSPLVGIYMALTLRHLLFRQQADTKLLFYKSIIITGCTLQWN